MTSDRVLFRLIRESLALSQQEAADWLGVNVKTVKRWENGQEPLLDHRLEELEDLAEAFAVDTAQKLTAAVTQVQEQMAEAVPLVVYTNEADYHGVAWPTGETWPSSKMHRAQVLQAYRAILAETEAEPILVPFDRPAYEAWLAGRPDSTQHRAWWAATTLS